MEVLDLDPPTQHGDNREIAETSLETQTNTFHPELDFTPDLFCFVLFLFLFFLLRM